MVGLDASPQLLRIAKQRYRAVDVVLGDMRFLPFKTASFTATVSMDTSFGYLPSEENDLQSLLEIRRVLRHEGEFILDVFNRENLVAKYLGKQSPTKLREYLHFFLLQERELCNGGICLRDRWVIEKSSEEGLLSMVRLYTRQWSIFYGSRFAVNGFTVAMKDKNLTTNPPANIKIKNRYVVSDRCTRILRQNWKKL